MSKFYCLNYQKSETYVDLAHFFPLAPLDSWANEESFQEYSWIQDFEAVFPYGKSASKCWIREI